MKYYQGKVDAFQGDFFHLTDSAAKLVLERVHNDTKFLAEVGLMDYSIILGVRRCPLKDYKPGVFPKASMDGSDQPYISIHKGEVWSITTLVLLTSCRMEHGKTSSSVSEVSLRTETTVHSSTARSHAELFLSEKLRWCTSEASEEI